MVSLVLLQLVIESSKGSSLLIFCIISDRSAGIGTKSANCALVITCLRSLHSILLSCKNLLQY